MWASFVRKRGLGFHLGILVFSSPSEVCEANDQRVCLYVQAKQAVVTPNIVKTSVGRQLRKRMLVWLVCSTRVQKSVDIGGGLRNNKTLQESVCRG